MRIAVAYENETGEVFRHFGHTEFFKLYNVEGGRVMSSLVIAAPEQGHDALAAFLGQMRVNALICGDIGGGARKALEEVGVILYGGVAGSADTAVNIYFDHSLAATQTLSGAPAFGNGAGFTLGSAGFSGAIDELRLRERFLCLCRERGSAAARAENRDRHDCSSPIAVRNSVEKSGA